MFFRLPKLFKALREDNLTVGLEIIISQNNGFLKTAWKDEKSWQIAKFTIRLNFADK